LVALIFGNHGCFSLDSSFSETKTTNAAEPFGPRRREIGEEKTQLVETSRTAAL
jgi:hypothetical protein